MEEDLQGEIARRLAAEFPEAEIDVHLDGNRATLDVCSNHFADMSRVGKQQAVYACIQDFISSGVLHAVTINARVPD